MVNMLSDQQLQKLADLYNRWLSRENMHSIYWGDFHALPIKIPHGPIANAGPLLNFHTLWKIFSACMKHHVSPHLCQSETIPTTQFTL